MEDKELLERLNFIEFRQRLLFENNSYSRLLFDHNITEKQSNRIYDLLDEYRNRIDNGEDVHHGSFEQSIYEIAPHKQGDYHFAEDVAQINHERGSYEEVFEQLYGDMPKFQNYMSNHKKD
ncbi:DUF1878 domain-containing protein [Salinibacillus xinjiangensis]|uniref:DUF1878 domain-containing protein n=1 Tax=Salinibacillus xinjiangensis TaxID=1229268 RepID=A0A6G1X7L4_9BACI|nr:DUF1878 domain-containing protein [Salinibacillus xinjiangensis]MRG86993.1 DUF1878 domain-containing protein [Salinibacillus xinjiangensis]